MILNINNKLFFDIDTQNQYVAPPQKETVSASL